MEMITIQCSSCGHSEEATKYCPYLGHLHGNGWTYVCPHCRHDMKVKEINE